MQRQTYKVRYTTAKGAFVLVAGTFVEVQLKAREFKVNGDTNIIIVDGTTGEPIEIY